MAAESSRRFFHAHLAVWLDSTYHKGLVDRGGLESGGPEPPSLPEESKLNLCRENPMFQGLRNLGNLMKQAQQIGSQMQEMNAKMRQLRVSGQAGGGMVEIESNGLMEFLQCKIDPTLLNPEQRELLEDLIVAAANQVIEKAKQSHAESMQGLAGGMNLPGLGDALAQFTGGAADGPEEIDDDSEETNP